MMEMTMILVPAYRAHARAYADNPPHRHLRHLPSLRGMIMSDGGVAETMAAVALATRPIDGE
jgi:hypothetical protein